MPADNVAPIEIHGLTKNFGAVRALDGLDLTVREGEVHGFENTSCEPFTYLAITAPPIDFSYAYKSAQ